MNLIPKMRRKIKFEINRESKWNAVIPEWMGEKSDLEMVDSADELCDILAESEKSFYLDISDGKIPGAEELIFLIHDEKEIGSAWYFLTSYKGIEYNMKIRLREAAEFILGGFPQRIYFYRETVF